MAPGRLLCPHTFSFASATCATHSPCFDVIGRFRLVANFQPKACTAECLTYTFSHYFHNYFLGPQRRQHRNMCTYQAAQAIFHSSTLPRYHLWWCSAASQPSLAYE